MIEVSNLEGDKLHQHSDEPQWALSRLPKTV